MVWFLEVARSFVHKVQIELETSSRDKEKKKKDTFTEIDQYQDTICPASAELIDTNPACNTHKGH